MVGHCRNTWWLATPGMLGGWALQGYFAVGHCRDTMQGDPSIGHCKDTLRLCRDTQRLGIAGMRCHSALQSGSAQRALRMGTAGILSGGALQGYSAVGHRRDTLRMGTAGILCGWAFQGCVAILHCSQAPRGGQRHHRLLKFNNGNKVVSTSSVVQAVLPYTLEQRLF